MTPIQILEQAFRDAEFDVTGVRLVTSHPDPAEYQIEVGKDDGFYVEITKDGEVIWWDFSHTTLLGDVNCPESLTEALTELLPLRDEALAEWIGHRQPEQRFVLRFLNDVRECRLVGTEYVHILNSSSRIKTDDWRIVEIKPSPPIRTPTK